MNDAASDVGDHDVPAPFRPGHLLEEFLLYNRVKLREDICERLKTRILHAAMTALQAKPATKIPVPEEHYQRFATFIVGTQQSLADLTETLDGIPKTEFDVAVLVEQVERAVRAAQEDIRNCAVRVCEKGNGIVRDAIGAVADGIGSPFTLQRYESTEDEEEFLDALDRAAGFDLNVASFFTVEQKKEPKITVTFDDENPENLWEKTAYGKAETALPVPAFRWRWEDSELFAKDKLPKISRCTRSKEQYESLYKELERRMLEQFDTWRMEAIQKQGKIGVFEFSHCQRRLNITSTTSLMRKFIKDHLLPYNRDIVFTFLKQNIVTGNLVRRVRQRFNITGLPSLPQLQGAPMPSFNRAWEDFVDKTFERESLMRPSTQEDHVSPDIEYIAGNWTGHHVMFSRKTIGAYIGKDCNYKIVLPKKKVKIGMLKCELPVWIFDANLAWSPEEAVESEFVCEEQYRSSVREVLPDIMKKLEPLLTTLPAEGTSLSAVDFVRLIKKFLANALVLIEQYRSMALPPDVLASLKNFLSAHIAFYIRFDASNAIFATNPNDAAYMRELESFYPKPPEKLENEQPPTEVNLSHWWRAVIAEAERRLKIDVTDAPENKAKAMRRELVDDFLYQPRSVKIPDAMRTCEELRTLAYNLRLVMGVSVAHALEGHLYEAPSNFRDFFVEQIDRVERALEQELPEGTSANMDMGSDVKELSPADEKQREDLPEEQCEEGFYALSCPEFMQLVQKTCPNMELVSKGMDSTSLVWGKVDMKKRLFSIKTTLLKRLEKELRSVAKTACIEAMSHANIGNDIRSTAALHTLCDFVRRKITGSVPELLQQLTKAPVGYAGVNPGFRSGIDYIVGGVDEHLKGLEDAARKLARLPRKMREQLAQAGDEKSSQEPLANREQLTTCQEDVFGYCNGITEFALEEKNGVFELRSLMNILQTLCNEHGVSVVPDRGEADDLGADEVRAHVRKQTEALIDHAGKPSATVTNMEALAKNLRTVAGIFHIEKIEIEMEI